MNKIALRFVFCIMVSGLLLSGCQRLQKKVQDLNQNQNSSPTLAAPQLPTAPAQPSQQQPTQPPASSATTGATLAPSPTAPVLQPTKTPVVLQTNSPSTTESDQLLNDLDNSLNDLTNSLNSVDTIKSIP